MFCYTTLCRGEVSGMFEAAVLVITIPVHADKTIGLGVKVSRLHNHKMTDLMTEARIRDFNELAGYSPVFYCSGEAAQSGSHGLMPVAVNVPVSLRGTTIVPGDYIYADRVAAVVIPAARIDRVLELAREIAEPDTA